MKISVIIPIYNEEDAIPQLKSRLVTVLDNIDYDYEIIAVNDGSEDASSDLIKEWIRENSNVILIEFSRNFGHQQAITAGLNESSGDAAIIIDADLQDPPEKIPEMIAKWQEGYNIVLAERTQRRENFMRKFFFDMFYKFFDYLSELPFVVSSGVFGLMDRTVVNHVLSFKERNRFIPGLRGWVGYKTATIYYKREDRSVGEPKQSFTRLLKYGLDAIFSFSYKPLRISFVIGLCVSTFFFIYGGILVAMRLMNINVVRGFTTPTVAIFFIGGILLISNGIIGEYLARIYDEVKRRPLYIIAQRTDKNSLKPADRENHLLQKVMKRR